jgi:ABC-2 type transport system ATP-binding protein
VLDIVGLHEVAGRRAGTFSLGMAQRLGIATALLGDPGAPRARENSQPRST